MNKLTSQQRKIVYVLIVAVLMVPIIFLGMPATGDPGTAGTRGTLARLREEYDLGEQTLGKVDPASTTMNLMLLGMRGVAVNLLWLQMEEQKKTKQWAKMRATTESIILLQPHYLQVWDFNGWNLAYNVSAEWDAVEDRYYWVKEGAKFYMRGVERNRNFAELYFKTGGILGQKIGRSDEWRHFRRFFLDDPLILDPITKQPKHVPDPVLNPAGKDNYLVAREWYLEANRVEEEHDQHVMMRCLFRSYPARSLLDYADALQREGIFDERARTAWERAFKAWVNEYGQMYFDRPTCRLKQEVNSEEEIEQLVRLNQSLDNPTYKKATRAIVLRELVRTQNITNYRYWRMRALAEAEPDMVAAHRAIYEGEQAFRDADHDRCRRLMMEGLRRLQSVIARPEFRDLAQDNDTVEEAMWAILLWKKSLQLLGEPVPENYPLKNIWDAYPHLLPQINERLQRLYVD